MDHELNLTSKYLGIHVKEKSNHWKKKAKSCRIISSPLDNIPQTNKHQNKTQNRGLNFFLMFEIHSYQLRDKTFQVKLKGKDKFMKFKLVQFTQNDATKKKKTNVVYLGPLRFQLLSEQRICRPICLSTSFWIPLSQRTFEQLRKIIRQVIRKDSTQFEALVKLLSWIPGCAQYTSSETCETI